MSSSRHPTSILSASLAFLPIALYWLLKEWVEPRPFWVFYDHIESLYYYTAMELLKGDPIHNVDNPGTLVQIVGAGVLAVLGTKPADYPAFVVITHTLILMLSFLAALIMVRLALAKVSVLMRLAVVWMYFVFSVALLYFNVWSPEAFYFVVGAICVGLLFNFLDQEPAGERLAICLFGASIGALISIKFIFLAWLPGLCLMLFVAQQGWARKISHVATGLICAALGFLLCTLPVREQYSYMFGWIFQNATRDGQYGRGGTSAPDWYHAVETWLNFAQSAKGWLLLFLVLLIATVVLIKRGGRARRDASLVLAFVIPSVVFSFLFVIRSYQQRYMLPVGLCGVMLAVLCAREFTPTARWVQLLIVAVILGLLLKAMHNDFGTHQRKIAGESALRVELETKISELAAEAGISNPVVVQGWRTPSPAFALRQHALLEPQQRAVDKLYPNIGHYTPWPVGQQTFRPPSGQPDWDFAIIRQEYVDELPVAEFQIIDSVRNYKILAAPAIVK